jgi:hypothetical protein
MNIVEILKAARELISDEKNWAQCCNAIDASGNDVSPMSEEASRFCSIGALVRVGWRDPYGDPARARDCLRECLTGGHSIVSFSDTHTHAEVLALFDRAIVRAESEAA